GHLEEVLLLVGGNLDGVLLGAGFDGDLLLPIDGDLGPGELGLVDLDDDRTDLGADGEQDAGRDSGHEQHGERSAGDEEPGTPGRGIRENSGILANFATGRALGALSNWLGILANSAT